MPVHADPLTPLVVGEVGGVVRVYMLPPTLALLPLLGNLGLVRKQMSEGWICFECREDPSLAAMDEEDPLACLPMVREEAQVKPVPTWRRAQCGMCTVEFFSSSFLVSPPKLFPFQELQPGRGSWFQVFI